MDNNAAQENLESLPDPQAEEEAIKAQENQENSLKARKNKNSYVVNLSKDIRVDFKNPLSHLDKGGTKVYRAMGTNKVSADIIAFVCDRNYTPRRQAAIKYTKVFNPCLPKLIEYGKIYDPHDSTEKFAFIYENNFGQQLLTPKHTQAALAFKPDDVMVNIVKPFIRVLIELRSRDVVHGEIWPGNMFYSGLDAGEGMRLGECLSAPAASRLPALYEPVERSMADPCGKGRGSFSDDLYSFGVSLAVIMRTTDPFSGLSDDEIIERKIEKGSYTTLIGKDRLSGAMLELMRGLLYDDESQRWNLDDVEAWLDGRRLSPKQSSKRIKAARPIIFADKKYIRPEILAKDLYKHPDETLRFIENGEMYQWVDRAIEDKAIKARLEQLTKDMELLEKGDGYNKRLATLVSAALYTDAPLIYDGIKFLPLGFGKAMSAAYRKKEDMKPYIEAMRYMFVIPAMRFKKTTNLSPIINRFDSCRAAIMQTKIGFGLERCLYLMDTECPCLSPLLEKFYIQSPEELVRALEIVCEEDTPKVIFDRHIQAFLGVKDRKNIDPYAHDLRSDEESLRILGQLRALATIQKRSALEPFPAIANWFSNNFDSLYGRFHDADKRDSLKKKIEEYKKSGDLAKIAVLFDDPGLYQNDQEQFEEAIKGFKKLEEEKATIEEKLQDKKNYGRVIAQQVASVISLLISFIFILIITYFSFIAG